MFAIFEYHSLTPSIFRSPSSRMKVLRKISLAPLPIAECFIVSSMSLMTLTPVVSMTLTSSVAESLSDARTRTCVGIKSRAARSVKCPDSSVVTALDFEVRSL